MLVGGISTEPCYYDGTDSIGTQGSIKQKSDYALTNHMAGMMAWRMDNDIQECGDPTSSPPYPTYQGATALWEYMNNGFQDLKSR